MSKELTSDYQLLKKDLHHEDS